MCVDDAPVYWWLSGFFDQMKNDLPRVAIFEPLMRDRFVLYRFTIAKCMCISHSTVAC
jgi:hypothetical protein